MTRDENELVEWHRAYVKECHALTPSRNALVALIDRLAAVEAAAQKVITAMFSSGLGGSWKMPDGDELDDLRAALASAQKGGGGE